MLAPFATLPPTARIWIYQANRSFINTEKEIIFSAISSFLEQWTAHGNTLTAGVDLPFNQFVVIGLDEQSAGASGCSIDSLFRVLQQTGEATGIDFFNRDLVAFKRGDTVELVNRTKVKEVLVEWGGGVLTFNNLITVRQQLETEWIVPAHTTWLKRYIAPISV